MQPTDLRIIRVPCSGRVNPLFVLKALINGATAFWCRAAIRATATIPRATITPVVRLELLKDFLPVIGINPDRFEYTWVSASEGQRWKDVVTNFTNPHPCARTRSPLGRRARPL